MTGFIPTPGTPSALGGTINPCQWRAVPSGKWLIRVIRTWSPAVTRIIGPGTVPSMVQASTRWPLTVSHMTCFAVNVKCLAPSGSTTYFASCPPYDRVALGTFAGAVVGFDVFILLEEDVLVEVVLELTPLLFPAIVAPRP